MTTDFGAAADGSHSTLVFNVFVQPSWLALQKDAKATKDGIRTARFGNPFELMGNPFQNLTLRSQRENNRRHRRIGPQIQVHLLPDIFTRAFSCLAPQSPFFSPGTSPISTQLQIGSTNEAVSRLRS
jgi:hypothetical protein